MTPSRYLFYKVIFLVVFSITYSFLEVRTPFYLYINPYIYRVIYFIFFFVASMVPDVVTTFSLFLYSMTLEDVFYWILADQLPFSYAWYYPVVDHIPIVDVVEVVIATALLEFRHVRIRVPDFHTVGQCDMWYWFLRGKTHDLYGLLLLIFLSTIVYILDNNAVTRLVSILEIVISSNIFVDLWAHCFHH